MNKVYLSIGSNLGDRESNIASSIAMLDSFDEITNIKSSSFYKTEPLFNENQPYFLNIVIGFIKVSYGFYSHTLYTFYIGPHSCFSGL